MEIISDITMHGSTWDDIIINGLVRYCDLTTDDLGELLSILQLSTTDSLHTNVQLSPRLGTLDEVSDDMLLCDLDPHTLSEYNFDGEKGEIRIKADVDLTLETKSN